MDASWIVSRRLITISIGIFALTILSACSIQSGSNPEAVDESTEPHPSATGTLTPTPTHVPSPEPYAINLGCVDCHTDKEMLISTASQVVDEKPESSGEG